MAVADIVRLLETNALYSKRVVCRNLSEPEAPRYGALSTPLPDVLTAYLDQNNIRLYTHQCDAINHIRSGKNAIITTPTASGKTLSFNLPVFERIHADPDARALYLYPTKALSNDQYATLSQVAQFTGIPAKPGNL